MSQTIAAQMLRSCQCRAAVHGDRLRIWVEFDPGCNSWTSAPTVTAAGSRDRGPRLRTVPVPSASTLATSLALCCDLATPRPCGYYWPRILLHALSVMQESRDTCALPTSAFHRLADGLERGCSRMTSGLVREEVTRERCIRDLESGQRRHRHQARGETRADGELCRHGLTREAKLAGRRRPATMRPPDATWRGAVRTRTPGRSSRPARRRSRLDVLAMPPRRTDKDGRIWRSSISVLHDVPGSLQAA